MHRPVTGIRAVLASAAAVTAAAVTAGAVVVDAAAARVSGASVAAHALPAGTGHPRLRPPIPLVSTLGTARRATLVSYCWSRTVPGGGEGVCADGNPGNPAHILRWRPGANIRLDLRLPAHDVRVQAARFGGIGSRPNDVHWLKVVQADAAGRRWTLHLPRRAARDTDLLIFARFANGDIAADLGIHRR